MPVTYIDQFWAIDPGNILPPVGTQLQVFELAIIDQNDNGFIGDSDGDTIDGAVVIQTYPGDTVTVLLEDGSSVTVTGSTFVLADGRNFFTPSDGSVLTAGAFQSATLGPSADPIPVSSLAPACFVSGTLIQTIAGPVPVERLMEGDKIRSHNGENIAIRKVLLRQISARELYKNPKLRPVCITAGALGSGLPERNLLVSRQHRMLIRSPIAKSMFGTPDVLVSAIKLTEMPGIYVDESVTHVTYVHLVFDKHELILAEGSPTESLLLGPMALDTLDPDSEREIREIFPNAFDPDQDAKPICLIPTNKMQKQLVSRHLESGLALDQSQKRTVEADAIAERKVSEHPS